MSNEELLESAAAHEMAWFSEKERADRAEERAHKNGNLAFALSLKLDVALERIKELESKQGALS